MLKPILLSCLLATAALALALPAPVHANGDACEDATWDLVAAIDESRANGGLSPALGPAIHDVAEACAESNRSDENNEILARPPPELDPRRPLVEEIPKWEEYGEGVLANKALMTCKAGRVQSNDARFNILLGVADPSGVLHGINSTTTTERFGSAAFEFNPLNWDEDYSGVSEEVGLLVWQYRYGSGGTIILFPNAPYEVRLNSDDEDVDGACQPMEPPCGGWAWATAIRPPFVVKVESDFSKCPPT
ncbi:MAG TPA: hypothetical protein VM889_02690 [Candidatus Thermoplasmatota archaeon]|nr:hypothetical protein [Candidatus Thermoplasmatota archaeon]